MMPPWILVIFSLIQAVTSADRECRLEPMDPSRLVAEPPENWTMTDSFVEHIEADLYMKGNLIFNDNNSIKTSNGSRTELVCGDSQYAAYEEGRGSAAKFYSISGFNQVNSSLMLVVDQRAHCVRTVNRVKRSTARLISNCRDAGDSIGSFEEVRFAQPHSILKLSDGMFLITDSGNAALKLINLVERTVTKPFQGGPFNYPMDMVISGSELYVTVRHGVVKVDFLTNSIVMITKSAAGCRDSFLADSSLKEPTSITSTPSLDSLVIGDLFNARLRVVDLMTQTVRTLCWNSSNGGKELICEMNDPLGVLVYKRNLYVGNHGGIRKIRLTGTDLREWLKSDEKPLNPEELRCPALPKIPHSKNDGLNTPAKVGQTVHFRCVHGHEMVEGTEIFVCLVINRRVAWFGVTPKCRLYPSTVYAVAFGLLTPILFMSFVSLLIWFCVKSPRSLIIRKTKPVVGRDEGGVPYGIYANYKTVSVRLETRIVEKQQSSE